MNMRGRLKSRYGAASATILLLMLGACSDDADNAAQGPFSGSGQTAPAVEVVRARMGTLPLEERVTGQVTARNQTEIYPEVAGPISEVHVENGDLVEAGDPLVRLRDSELRERYQQAVSGLEIAEAQTRQAEASLELAQAQFDRTKSLVDRSLETSATLDTARSEVSIAEADLDLREAQENQARSLAEERLLQLQNATIVAPIDGTVGQRNAEVGQLATTTTRLFVIGDLSEVRVEMLLSERMLNDIQEGMPVNVFSDSWPDTVISSTVSRISPFLDINTLRTTAVIETENSRGLLRPGMFVSVDILYGESEEAVLVPNSALYRHPRTGIEGVYVISQPDPDAAEMNPDSEPEGVGLIGEPQPVNFVAVDQIASGRMATAVSGVQEGDWVLTVGQNLLDSGAEEARPRLLPWDRMMQLQELQSDDMFEIIDQNRQDLTESSS